MPTGVIIIGSRKTTRKKRRPATSWAQRNASHSPSQYWTVMPTTT